MCSWDGQLRQNKRGELLLIEVLNVEKFRTGSRLSLANRVAPYLLLQK